MQKRVVMMFIILSSSYSVAMDDTKQLKSIGGRWCYKGQVVVNRKGGVCLKDGLKYDLLKVLALRNTLVQMANKNYEGALKLLEYFCTQNIIYEALKVINQKGVYVFVQKKHIKKHELQEDIEILLRKKLIKRKKNIAAYQISHFVHNVAGLSIQSHSGGVKINEPSESFDICKKVFGRGWQKEVSKLVKK